jgi:hypothetical protein
MTNFGLIKSKIENVLLESYSKDTFKNELKTFKKLVLENKNICKLFYLYDDLLSNKGLNESTAKDYIHECITIYENTINKVKDSDFNNIKKWVGNVKTENRYSNIDNLFSNDVLTIESRLESKKMITESLKKTQVKKSDSVNIPLSTMVNVANKTIKNYIDTLNESDKSELIKLLSEDDNTLSENFNDIKNSVVRKLTEMKNTNNDSSTQSRIEETINKVISEKYDKLTYFKLKSLNENI